MPDKKTQNMMIRIVVFGALTIAVIFVLLKKSDDGTQNDAISTHNAWQEALEEAESANNELRHSQLKAYIKGDPRIERNEDPNRTGVRILETYVWSGTFNEVRIEVELGLPVDDPAVSQIVKLGE